MAEKRVFGRFKRRLVVWFGKGNLDQRGTTGNISATGILVHANRVQPKGALIQVELQLPDVKVQTTMQVAWSRPAPPGTRGMVLGAMGLRFDGTPPEAYYAYLVACESSMRTGKQ